MSEQYTYWLVVERYENWISDRQNGFCRYGIPHRLRNLASKVKRGDRLITYVSSRHSAFADIRCVTSDELQKINGLQFYDDPFQYSIQTKPILTLEQDAWVKVKPHLAELNFTREHKSWGVVFYTALRKLDLVDGKYIEDLISRSISSI